MKPQSESALTILAGALGVFVVLAGVHLLYLSPERAWAWLLAMCVLPLGWAVLQRAKRATSDARFATEERKLLQAMVGAGALLAVSLVVVLIVRLGWAGGFAAELSERSRGFLMGAMVMVFANAVPKQAGSARRQAALRICGWALVLSGLGYAASWLFVPLAYANIVAMLVLLCGLVYSVGRIGRMSLDRRAIAPPSSE